MSNFECFECSKPAKHAHHVVPVSRGGKRTIPLCLKCHGKIHARTMHHSNLTRAGMRAKMAQGMRPGTPPAPIDLPLINQLKSEGHTIAEIAKRVGLSKSQLYRRLSSLAA